MAPPMPHRRSARPIDRTTLPPRRLLAAAAFALLAGCGEAVAVVKPPPDVTLTALPLGTPFTPAAAYARNVWDMQRFGGVIFLGHGDSIDNWGPIPIWSLDPATGALASVFTTSEEQVDAFRVIGGTLYVPGHDPRDDFSFGNFYRLDAGGWVKRRAIPFGLHTFDLRAHDGLLFAALGADSVPGHVTLRVSADGGATWSPAADDVLGRVYDLFELNGTLYGAPALWPGNPAEEHRILRWNGTRFVRTDAELDAVYLGIHGPRQTRMVRPTEFGGALVYGVALGSFDWSPVALAISRDGRAATRVTLPDAAALPYDLLVRGGTLYVLTGTRQADGSSTVRVYQTADLARWTELFHLAAPTFARSFEENGGDFFLGLGCDHDRPVPASGTLLRVSRASYAH